MNNPPPPTLVPFPSVAFIITHTIKPGEESRYEAWLTDVLSAVSKAPGYLGREVFRPAQGLRTYTSILRFDSDANLQAWSGSPDRDALVEQVSGLLENGDIHEIRTGIDFWFTPQSASPPKPWKQFLLVLSAIYPLGLLVPFLLSPLFTAAPLLTQPLFRGLLVSAIVVALMTFVVMPRYTRLARRWLHDGTT